MPCKFHGHDSPLICHRPCRDAKSDVQTTALTALLALASHHRQPIAARYATKKPTLLLKLLSHVDITVRSFSARLLGVATTALSAQAATNLIDQLTDKLPSADGGAGSAKYEEQHGATIAAGFVCAAACLGGVATGAVKTCVSRLVGMLGGGEATLAAAAAGALGHVQLAAPLPIDVGEESVVEVDAKAVPTSAAGARAACTCSCRCLCRRARC